MVGVGPLRSLASHLGPILEKSTTPVSVAYQTGAQHKATGCPTCFCYSEKWVSPESNKSESQASFKKSKQLSRRHVRHCPQSCIPVIRPRKLINMI